MDIISQDESLLIRDTESKNVARFNEVQDRDGFIKSKEFSLHDDLGWSEVPEGFIHGIEECLPTVSQISKNIMFRGIYIEGNDIVGIDYNKIGWAKVNEQITEDKIIIPYKPISALLKKWDNITHYDLDDAWIHFKDANGNVCSILLIAPNFLEDDLTPLDVVMEELDGYDGFEILLSDEMKNGIKHAVSMSDTGKTGTEISLVFKNGVVSCVGMSNKGKVSSTIEIDSDYTGRFKLMAESFAYGLSLFDRMYYKEDDDKIVFKNPNFKYALRLAE